MSWLSNYSIRKRVFLMVGIGLAFILTLLVFFSIEALQKSADRTLTERLSVARLVAGHIDDHIADTLSLLERAAASKGFDLTDADPAPERRTLRELHRAGVFSCHVFITDRRGVVLLTEPYGSKFTGEDRSVQPYIAAALRTGRPQVSGHFICPVDVSSRVGFAIPVKDRKGAVAGLLGGVTDPTSPAFAGMVRSSPAIEAGHMDVADADGIVLASDNHAFVAKKSHHPGIADLIKSGTAVFEQDAFGEAGHPLENSTIVFAPLKNAPWGVIIAQPESVILAPVNALRRRLIALGVIFAVLALLVTWLTTQAVLKPIQQLLTASRRIGEGDLGTPVTVTGRDEVAELARGFEAMRQKVAARGEELEMAVRERTRELSILLDIVRTAAESHNLEDVFNSAILKTNIGGKIFMLEKNGQLPVAAHHGVPADHPCLREAVRMGECLCGLAARDGRVIVSEDAAGDERHTRCWPEMPPHKDICVPLVARDQVMGVMNVWLPIHQKVTESDVDLLKAIGQQLGGVVQNARLREAEQRRLSEFTALFTVSSALREARSLDEMLPIILTKTLEILQTDTGAVFCLEERTQGLVARAAIGRMEKIAGLRLGPGEGVCGHVARTRVPYPFTDLAADPHTPDRVRPSLVKGVSGICLPLLSRETLVGTIIIGSETLRAFSDDEIRLLTAVADMAANAIHRATLIEELNQRVHQLSTLFEVGQGITANLRLEDVLALVAAVAPRALHAEGSYLFLWDEREERLVLRAATGFMVQDIGLMKYRSGEGLSGWVFLERKSASVPDVTADPRWKPHQNCEGELPIGGGLPRNAVVVPLLVGEKTLGALGLVNKVAAKDQKEAIAPFTPADEEFLAALAGQTAIAIENARLYEDVRGLSVAAIRSLATAIDARDPYTHGHSVGVAELSVQLARELGWKAADLEMLEFAALLHDVGKIAVPDAILRKVEPLTPADWGVIRLHPYQSAQIIKPVGPLKRIVPGVYHHHERWGGKGYPDEVKGDNIPPAARIIAIADSFNAMTTDRPYRKALSVAAAVAEIKRCAGEQFDPAAVEAFLRTMEK